MFQVKNQAMIEILNKYFILSLPEPALNKILEHCVENADTVRKNNDSTKAVVKLPVGATTPTILNSVQEYDHDIIIIEMAKAEWVEE